MARIIKPHWVYVNIEGSYLERPFAGRREQLVAIHARSGVNVSSTWWDLKRMVIEGGNHFSYVVEYI